eukprot:scaffold1634_cov118-Skeletonema_dohrnii-CCMP3373.AAC.19
MRTSIPAPSKAENEAGTHRRHKRTPLGIKSVAGIVAICLFTSMFQNGLIQKNTIFVLDDNNNQSTNPVSSGDDAGRTVHVARTRSSNFSTPLNLNKTHASNNSTHPEPTDRDTNTTTSIAKATTSTLSKRPHLWLDTITYAEGIAGWKTSLLELLYFAQKVNGGGGGATLVEPCMTSGRLRSCGRYETRGVPVSEIFDLDEYMTPPSDGNGSKYPVMVSYDDYQRIVGNTNTTVAKTNVCMLHSKSLSYDKRCTKDTSWIMTMKQNNLQRMMDNSNQQHFILHLEDYWRGSIYELGWQLGMYIPNDKQERFVKGMEIPHKGVFEGKTIPFHMKHVQFVEDLLQRANITNDNFSAVHWRAEKKGMDFMRCARAVNEVKHIMLREMMTSNTTRKDEESSQHKFVLMSSLNENEDMMWSGSRNSIVNGTTTTPQQALHYLLHDNGFIKIDGLLEMQAKKVHNDPGMLAIYDLIIATKANNFATCARDGKTGCNGVTRRLCDACNHVGKFGRLATSLRKEDGDHRGSSFECWPTSE